MLWEALCTAGATEGFPQLRRGLTKCRDTGCNVVVPFFLTSLAHVYGNSSQPDEGLIQLAEAANLIETTWSVSSA